MGITIALLENEGKKNGLKVTDDLTIKTGELLAKTEELREVNESLLLLNKEIKKGSKKSVMPIGV